MAEPTPVIVFGAFDRHNLGDLLFAHLAEAQLAPRPVRFAGLAERDLSPFGGHRVQAIADLARAWGDTPAHVLHAGGELLTCTLYEAAVMLQTPEAARAAVARHDADPAGRTAWAQAQTGLQQDIAYLVSKGLFRTPGRFAYQAVGGVGLPDLPPALQQEAQTRLREADFIRVRDRFTQAALAGMGIVAALAPDPAVRVAELFGARIEQAAGHGQVAAVREAFPQGHVAVQFATEFGTDAVLRTLAGQLDRLHADTGLGIVLFRAGAAPWHDDLEAYRRLSGFMRVPAVRVFEDLDVWAICGLLAHAQAYCGSSLHGRIVAEAFGRAAVNLVESTRRVGKQAAYARTWHPSPEATLATPEGLAAALMQAMARPAEERLRLARAQAELGRETAQACLKHLG